MSESSEGGGGDGNSSGQTVNSSIDSQQQEEQQERSRRTVYKTTDLDVFNLLQRPVWVCLCGEEWGDEKRLLWGNTATVEMWNAPSLQAVLARDFNVDMSEAVKQRYHNVARKCQAGEVFSQQWTYYPKGKAMTVNVTFSEIWIKEENSDDGTTVRAVLADVQSTDEIKEQVHAEGLRSVEMLRHLPLPVSQFDLSGNVTLQNPEAHALFSKKVSSTTLPPSSSSSGETTTPAIAIESVTASAPVAASPTAVATTAQASSAAASTSVTTAISSTSISSTTASMAVASTASSPAASSSAVPVAASPAASSTSATSSAAVISTAASAATDSEYTDKNSNIIEDKEDATKITVDDDNNNDNNNQNEEDDENTMCEFVRRFVDRKLGHEILTSVVDRGADCRVEAEQLTRTGPRWFALTVKPSRDPVTGAPVLLYSARDVTQLRQAKQVEEASLIKSEFMSVMAHEIRTPFHQVNGFVELLGQTELNTQQRGYVQLIEHACVSMMCVLNDVLDFNKLEAGHMTMDSISFDPKDVAHGALAAVTPSVEKKKLALQHNLDACTIPKVVGDPNRLRQLLLNLLNNAVKFSEQGQVSLNVTWVNNTSENDGKHFSESQKDKSMNEIAMLEFSVLDTGIGIPSSHQEIIFQKYQQAGVQIARQYGGSGLGLAICSSLVDAMNGIIGVESELGKGSRFWFRIPFPKQPIGAAVETPTTAKPCGCAAARKSDASPVVEPEHVCGKNGDVKNLHILVAEDNKMNQKLAKSMLTRLGHAATIVEDGLQAIQAIEKQKFDLVLMDVQMPVMDGLEATKKIRESMGLSPMHLPVLGLTADFRPSELEDYVGIGMNSCIGKPVRLNLLKASILNVVAEATTKRRASLSQGGESNNVGIVETQQKKHWIDADDDRERKRIRSSSSA